MHPPSMTLQTWSFTFTFLSKSTVALLTGICATTLCLMLFWSRGWILLYGTASLDQVRGKPAIPTTSDNDNNDSCVQYEMVWMHDYSHSHRHQVRCCHRITGDDASEADRVDFPLEYGIVRCDSALCFEADSQDGPWLKDCLNAFCNAVWLAVLMLSKASTIIMLCILGVMCVTRTATSIGSVIFQNLLIMYVLSTTIFHGTWWVSQTLIVPLVRDGYLFQAVVIVLLKDSFIRIRRAARQKQRQ
ncbi:hypothetical protein BC939DRAFT_437927 [Gamsiella multidivaricata]|uniref:uncharacterized protein n=1 Tax=Gamsiella multidivaricata TaxID=101098 RepID=UPI00221F37F7|nr:uncharacterized protein BC939DRAFT_437927 [Gamsiella multidivaricata]KAI7831209.1 hypothetical protein BC939DRAFT_437927 [Gamsiella multidivaricata]